MGRGADNKPGSISTRAGVPAAEALSGEARRRFRGLLDDCPLQLDSYGEQMRAASITAIADLAAQEPNGPMPADAPTRTADLLGPGGDEPLPPSAPRILGTTGELRSGKDELAGHLHSVYANVTRFAFSDSIIAETNDWIGPYGYYIDQLNKVEPHNRQLLQVVGAGRKVEDIDYWNAPIEQQIRELLDSGSELVAITGLRVALDPDTDKISVAELDFLHRIGGEVWNVDRPGNPHKVEEPHYNEAGLRRLDPSAFDAWIVNGVEGDMQAYVDNIEAALRGRPQPHVPADYKWASELPERAVAEPAQV